MQSITVPDTILQSIQKEIVKVFCIYDGTNRLITRYEAVENQKDGGPCVRTDFTYIGATTLVEKMKETQDVWSSSYDF